MDLAAIRKNAREKLQGYCRVCPVCDGRACAGEVPGMGGLGTGSAFRANLAALAAYRFNMRTIHEVKEPDTTLELWGEKLALPVLAAPMTGTPYNMGGQLTEEEFIEYIIAGSLQAGTLGMSGDGADPTMYDSGLKAIARHQGKGIAIIKPRAQEEIIKRIRQAEAAGALAVGVDIDGAGLITMALKGQPVGPKTLAEIKELVQATTLPFILKGIMTPEEAELAVEAGAKAIVVSNHGGRVLDFTPGAAEVLPEIASRVKGKVLIFADGGVRSGADVLKLLALGADAVLVGRPLVVGAFGGGQEGVAFLLNKMKGELVQTMLLTGTASVKNVKREILF
ncbi:FMN-dependent dehydrogenase, includes L-lactate dehydrogenase and type II isopentenyl diphosphate isomerase [Carboxydocella sporoproducens DSM 16521]|uniref:L-lactate oxidase n=2 Tax=Carboxydocella TaxID=178898 RepID=A0A1T4NTB5_9FIRM|nr:MULTISPECIES: alpha-hydroxy-acid oxidizing protein [Carboxydocella]AVX20193.1 FMN-dependent dehydrogenase [Carboxydocella thermautotrophica]SJZ82377.1 FMN-dependent dehydrogenase, includes L-lactate dehydrogenase and type II isopentenyl diphosphate isomerase [Carboxydocella sporoproducens DSM 16521]